MSDFVLGERLTVPALIYRVFGHSASSIGVSLGWVVEWESGLRPASQRMEPTRDVPAFRGSRARLSYDAGLAVLRDGRTVVQRQGSVTEYEVVDPALAGRWARRLRAARVVAALQQSDPEEDGEDELEVATGSALDRLRRVVGVARLGSETDADLRARMRARFYRWATAEILS